MQDTSQRLEVRAQLRHTNAFVRGSNEAGVHCVTWWPDAGWPDTFLLVHTELADVRWHQLGDVLIHPPQLTFEAAEEVVTVSRRQLSGHSLTAAVVEGRGCLLRRRDGRQRFITSDDAIPDAVRRWCVLEYISMLLVAPPSCVHPGAADSYRKPDRGVGSVTP